MNPLSVSLEPSPVAAWVGLDWADQQHVICLYELATGHSALSCLEPKPDALQDWAALWWRPGGHHVGASPGRGDLCAAERGPCAVVSGQSAARRNLPVSRLNRSEE